MVILDEPYASDLLLDWLEESKHPVLANDFAGGIRTHELNLVDDAQAAKLIDSGQRLYTSSENALAWVQENVSNEGLKECIRVFKDKAEMRRRLASLDSGFFFRECTWPELQAVRFEDLPHPVVLKPSVGFCSMGVHVVASADEWKAALRNIEEESARWQKMYPAGVVGTHSFVIEGYIQGQEYALDAYYDGEGRSHVLNVMRHDFAGPEDTSDRMYVSGESIHASMAPLFKEWLDEVGSLVGAKEFPVHVEVRVQDGKILPIEFNPLRFAGLGGTDLSQYAFGFRTYEAFLDDAVLPDSVYTTPNSDSVVAMSLLGQPQGTSGTEAFDYDAFLAHFSDVCEMRRFDVTKTGSYGFLFIRADSPDSPELDFLLHADLRPYLLA